MKILQKAIEEFFEDTKGKKPLCFEKKNYKTWLKHEEIAHTEPRKFPCRDCTSKYQGEMRDKGMCHIPLIPVVKIAK